MFQSEELKQYIETSSTIKNESLVIAEWNLNIASNINKIGNYRYRPTDPVGSKYRNPASTFDVLDLGNFYTDATYSDIAVDGGFSNANTPVTFLSLKEKENLLYSLEDCFSRFRPRSGINKVRYFDSGFVHHSNQDMFRRPRYYMADKEDKFKYWTSYRTETSEDATTIAERGVASIIQNGNFYIEDAAPYVVYKEEVPANRIIVKMQTNVGTVDLGPFSNGYESFADPFFGNENKTVPLRWRIQYLKNNIWIDAISFTENSIRTNGLPIVNEDGYVEIAYGLKVPEQYKNSFRHVNTVSSADFLSDDNIFGFAYLVKLSETDIGTYYVWNGEDYSTFIPEYGWFIVDDEISNAVPYVTELSSPSEFINTFNETAYREFLYLQGLRVVVETMNKQDSTFDLIELSPRLSANLSDRTIQYSINKSASDLGLSGMPVGQLLASTGSLDIFDYDNSFSSTNTNSIVSKYISSNLQIKLYEAIQNVNSFDYYLPIKTMYADGFPSTSNKDRTVSITLRDLYFYFESLSAPQLLLTNVSLGYAVATLLDYVGFSNYVFLRNAGESDPVIPYFFVEPEKSVAEVLSDLAISTQSAMFFDEYNNFVVMSKNYIMPSEEERATDIVLYGSKDFEKTAVYANSQTEESLSNIAEISSQDNNIYNDGKITYTTRYIQKTYRNIEQASVNASRKNWVYRPVLMWEASPIEKMVSINGAAETTQDALAAIPLNSNLSDEAPSVVNHQVVNNIIDLGEGVYYLARYSGYFYSSGEIIRYDAVEYNIPGISAADGGPNVWISNTQEYEKYFSKIPFNGKMYPTGLVRIYSEPNYETIDGATRFANGPVAKHGRGQFGTDIVYHYAGLNPYWTNINNLRGCNMSSRYLFADPEGISDMDLSDGLVGIVTSTGQDSNVEARKGSLSGSIKDYLGLSLYSETEESRILSTASATTQSSALILTGRPFSTTENSVDFISYIPKPLTDKFTHFGTRMRILGKILNNENRVQSPAGSSIYYTILGTSPEKSITIGASSGGIGVLLNPENNNGYFFEIAALADPTDQVDNVIFYKLAKNESYDYLINTQLSATLQSSRLTATANGVLTIGEDNPVVGDRIYVTNQTQPLNNGYYVVTSTGSVSSPWVLSKDENAIPVKLWGTYSAGIFTDDGTMLGMTRGLDEDVTTVYDMAVEYENIGNIRRFYLYANNRVIATVDDPNPLPVYNNMALFVRGSSRCVFENIYALGNNYSQNTTFALDTPAKSVFSKQINASDALKKYAINGFVKSAYLGGISSAEPPKYNIYYDEFGTIMREAAYYNVKYDKAYPALYAKLIQNITRVKNLVVSGFKAGAYNAEFLLFNASDGPITLNEGGANVMIHGITFTQSSPTDYTVDEYFSRKSDFSDIEFVADPLVSNPQKAKEYYQDIKASRLTHGKRAFSLDAKYIQSQDDAQSLMSWMIQKIMKPRKSIGVRIFANPMIQLGDIVKINYKDSSGMDQVISNDTRFVVYNISYNRSANGPDMTIYLSEVI